MKDSVETTSDLITKAELAKKLKVTTKTIENWTTEGIISAIRIGVSTVRYEWLVVLDELKNKDLLARSAEMSDVDPVSKIPEELQMLPQWVICGADNELIDPKTRQPASLTKFETWGTFAQAQVAKGLNGEFNTALVLTKDDPYTLVTLHNAELDPAEEIDIEIFKEISAKLNSYSETCLSGRDIQIVVKASIPARAMRDKVEIYDSERIIVFTGDVFNESLIENFDEVLNEMYKHMEPYTGVNLVDLVELPSELDDEELVAKAIDAQNDDRFDMLCGGRWLEMGYLSQSEADCDLMKILCQLSSSNIQCRKIFRMSTLGKRDKAMKDNVYLDWLLGLGALF